jgi:DNA-binding MarR family transcriptional regulator
VRVEAVDLLRSLLMILMALDHTRDYFGNLEFDATKPLRSRHAMLLTRWVTHLCVPGLVALTGASVYLQRQRGMNKGLSRDRQPRLVRKLWVVLQTLPFEDEILLICEAFKMNLNNVFNVGKVIATLGIEFYFKSVHGGEHAAESIGKLDVDLVFVELNRKFMSPVTGELFHRTLGFGHAYNSCGVPHVSLSLGVCGYVLPHLMDGECSAFDSFPALRAESPSAAVKILARQGIVRSMSRANKTGPSDLGNSKTGFRSAPQEAYLRLLIVTSDLSHQVNQLLRSFDVTQPQFNVLRILAGAGPEGLGRNEITARMVTITPDMTRLLNRMTDKGWVVRERGTEDRREVPTTLTPAGKRLLRRIDDPLARLHAEQFDALGTNETGHLLRLLKMIMKAEPNC